MAWGWGTGLEMLRAVELPGTLVTSWSVPVAFQKLSLSQLLASLSVLKVRVMYEMLCTQPPGHWYSRFQSGLFSFFLDTLQSLTRGNCYQDTLTAGHQ